MKPNFYPNQLIKASELRSYSKPMMGSLDLFPALNEYLVEAAQQGFSSQYFSLDPKRVSEGALWSIKIALRKYGYQVTDCSLQQYLNSPEVEGYSFKVDWSESDER